MPKPMRLIEAAIKHLPPSASDLHLLDVGGVARPYTANRRDIVPHVTSLHITDWQHPSASMDGIITLDFPLKASFLKRALPILRPGGRLVMMFSEGKVEPSVGQMLEQVGYVRILVEQALPEGGLLVRGEQAHIVKDTHARIQEAVTREASSVDWTQYRGRYVHLLVQQLPNKPIWKQAPDEQITWRAAAIKSDGDIQWLAFSSLPQAVAFMQPAVVDGVIRDVNKVAKFSRETAQTWHESIRLNPTLDDVRHHQITYLPIDRATAEQPDE